MYYVHELHQKFGPFVQIAPREISVADPEAFGQIHKIGGGFTKSSWYTDLTAFERPTLFTMTSAKEHGARRKLLARGFSKSYLRQIWEPLVHQKIRMVVGKMKDESRRKGSTDALKWWTLMATDVSSHLMFGDSFHMIEKGQVRQSRTEGSRKDELTICRKTST
jgi:cytochrome P450